MSHPSSYQTLDVAGVDEALLLRSVVLQLLGMGASRLHALVRAELLPPPVRMGSSSRWLASEVRAVLEAARTGRTTDEDLRELTASLLSRREAANRAITA